MNDLIPLTRLHILYSCAYMFERRRQTTAIVILFAVCNAIVLCDWRQYINPPTRCARKSHVHPGFIGLSLSDAKVSPEIEKKNDRFEVLAPLFVNSKTFENENWREIFAHINILKIINFIYILKKSKFE